MYAIVTCDCIEIEYLPGKFTVAHTVSAVQLAQTRALALADAVILAGGLGMMDDPACEGEAATVRAALELGGYQRGRYDPQVVRTI